MIILTTRVSIISRIDRVSVFFSVGVMFFDVHTCIIFVDTFETKFTPKMLNVEAARTAAH